MTEQQIQQQIRIACSRGPMRLWRNNVGTGWSGNAIKITPGNRYTVALLPGDVVIKQARLVRYGLCPGSADLIGLQCLPSGLGRFVALEVKRPGGRATTEQLNWLATVREMGGIAGLVHSVEEADALLRGAP